MSSGSGGHGGRVAGRDVEGAVALVTGASSGLGAATATALAARGMRVVGLDLHPPRHPAPGSVHQRVDVTDARQVAAAVDRVGELDGPLRVVVGCAGTAPAERILGRSGPHSVERFRRTVSINLTGTALVMAAAVRLMLEQQRRGVPPGGLVVGTASVAAFEGQVGQAAYAAAKAGVVGLTERAAEVLAEHGVRVNAIAPGTFDTPMAATASPEVLAGIAATIPHPSRLGRPEEYAALVLELLDNPGITGQTVRLDGALRLAPR